MKFSVVTVCFNSAAVLPHALQSLQAQTFGDYEWVVVDGGSRDATMDLVRGFTAAPLNALSEPDAGIYDAMNKAIGRARGDYLYFLNSDDALAGPLVLAEAAQAIDAAGQPGLLVGRVNFVGPQGSALRSYAHIGPHTVLFDSLCHQAVFAQRALFDGDRFGRFDTGYRLAADFDWLARAIRARVPVAHTGLVVADFSAGGAHQQALETTRREMMAIRQRQTQPLERALTHAWSWLKHKSRRLAGLPAQGRA
ncbi:MAG: glycosyltransferase family 2 protein [Bacteroidia bacterium]